jgi:hypothetical protein
MHDVAVRCTVQGFIAKSTTVNQKTGLTSYTLFVGLSLSDKNLVQISI